MTTEQPAKVAVTFKLVVEIVGFKVVKLYLFAPLDAIVIKELSLDVKVPVLVHSTVEPSQIEVRPVKLGGVHEEQV